MKLRLISAIVLMMAAILVAGCCFQTASSVKNNQIVGTWTNGYTGDDGISYTFSGDSSVVYTTGAHSDHDAATYKGTWTDEGKYTDQENNTAGERYNLIFDDNNNVIDQDLILSNGQLTYETDESLLSGITEPDDTTLTKQ